MSNCPPRPVGAISWNELMTRDVEAAKHFYGALFDWKLETRDMGGFSYTLASSGDQEVAGLMALTDDAAGMPPNWGAYVTVDDVDATLKRVIELGGKVVVPAQDIPEVGRFAAFVDPQGAMLSVIKYSN